MNTQKDNLEHQIKKQIEEREIAPSRDLWSEIELQKEQKKSTSYMSWVWAAACIVLAFGLGFVLFSNPSDKGKTQHTEIAEIKNDPVQEKSSEEIHNDAEPVYADKNVTPEKDISTKITDEVQPSKVLAEQKQILQQKEGLQMVVPQLPKIKTEQIMAQADSAKIPAKRKKYVDPSTLLFSVEHKDVIEKTKESNVASVDLNAK